MDNRTAANIAYAIIKENRRREWRERMEENISRWEDSVDKINNAMRNARRNKESNQNKRYKAEQFLDKITSGKSKEWYDRTTNRLKGNIKPEKRVELQAKVDEYNEKVASTEDWIDRLTSWINEADSNCNDMQRKVWDLEGKIRDVYSKLR